MSERDEATIALLGARIHSCEEEKMRLTRELAEARAEVASLTERCNGLYEVAKARFDEGTRYQRERDEARRALAKVARLLGNIAAQCDAWARESHDGGWSTHQVDANRKLAVMCRDEAAALRASTGEGR